MPRENPIIGSGRRGFGFEQKGFQERNLGLLLETLSKKETQKSIEALSKIDKDEWIAIATTATTLNNFISLGGASTLISSVKETIKLQIDSILSPLTNEINQQITTILSPFINDVLTPVINDLNNFVVENSTGAALGGIAGTIAALWLPGGVLWVAIGALIGAALESSYGELDELVRGGPAGAPYTPSLTTLYEQETGNVFTSIFDWNYINWYQSRVPPVEQDRIGGPQEGF